MQCQYRKNNSFPEAKIRVGGPLERHLNMFGNHFNMFSLSYVEAIHCPRFCIILQCF